MGFDLRKGLIAPLMVLIAACAAPAPTATPAAAPGPTKAPTPAATATATKRPLTKIAATTAGFQLAHAMAWLADAKGYFREEGLDVDWTATGSGAKALAAIVSGSAQAGIPAAPDMINAVAQGQPVQVFGILSTGISGELTIRKDVAQKRGITAKMTLQEKAQAVKGLKFAATSPGSGSDFRVRFFLTQGGLDPERDVEITYIGVDSLPAALEQGSVDVVSTSQPSTALLVAKGVGEMLLNYTAGDVPGTKEGYFITATGHRPTMERQPEIYEAFARGLWRATRLVEQNQKDAADVLQKAKFSDLDSQAYKIAFEATLDFRNKTEAGPPVQVKFEDFGTNRFVEAAKKQLGY
ncbi:MAG: ABC transporter substrate-binding protein [Chloroflexi bacterium]|nr:ABC transporter substrate-binding protein [Chloroflexota bacterium]